MLARDVTIQSAFRVKVVLRPRDDVGRAYGVECRARNRGCKVSERPRFGLVTLSSVTGDVRY